MGTSTKIFMMAKHFVFVFSLCLTLALSQDFAPEMVTGSDLTSPPPEDSCMKVDCMDESFCALACDGIDCMGYEWIVIMIWMTQWEKLGAQQKELECATVVSALRVFG